VVVAVEGTNEKHGIDVSGDDLFDDILAGGLAGKLCPTREDRVDMDAGGFANLRRDRDPVADGWEGGLRRGGIDKLSGTRPKLGAELAGYFKIAFELERDAPGLAALGRVGREGLRKKIRPAEFSQRHEGRSAI